jgi:hypothetical protein
MNFTNFLDKSTTYSAFALLLLCSSFCSPALANANPVENSECVALAIHANESKRVSAARVGGEICTGAEVSTPAATWLFGCALMGFVGLSNKRRA